MGLLPGIEANDLWWAFQRASGSTCMHWSITYHILLIYVRRFKANLLMRMSSPLTGTGRRRPGELRPIFLGLGHLLRRGLLSSS